MVDRMVYGIDNVFLEVEKWNLGITVVEDFHTESGEIRRKQVATGIISTNVLDFWRCIRDVAEQHRETKEIMTAIDILIENAEEKAREAMAKMRKDAEAVGYKGSQVDDVIREKELENDEDMKNNEECEEWIQRR